jgi:hypothetical protein
MFGLLAWIIVVIWTEPVVTAGPCRPSPPKLQALEWSELVEVDGKQYYRVSDGGLGLIVSGPEA